MILMYSRPVTISLGAGRKATNWQPATMEIGALWDRLQTPTRTGESFDEYTRMKKSQQDELKDVGGFVGGTLDGPRRKAAAVTGRDLITLDFDNIPAYGLPDVSMTLDALCCGYALYTTRKHCTVKPRARVVIPTSRTMTVDEYEPVARKMAQRIGIAMADPTTFEASRLMYWPSCSTDGEFEFRYADAPLLDPDAVLAAYDDWHDWQQWPQVPGSAVNYAALAVKQGNPESKPGLVGAFCRTYDVPAVLDGVLSGVYQQCDTDTNRYTYLGGSTAGGAVLYDDGRFLYSHHATDPCSGKLVNAFDLVRLHKFGDLDDDAAPDTPINRMPSYVSMLEYVNNDAAVGALLVRERREQAAKEFADIETPAAAPGENATQDDMWELQLQRNAKTGKLLQTIDNALIILEHDPRLKGCFALNQFAQRGEVLRPLPWSTERGEDFERCLWTDSDSNGLYWYMEHYYDLTATSKIDAALDLHSVRHAFNEVRDYLNSLKWDGKPRLDTLFIDHLGAVDSEYNRAVTRKSLCAAVARALKPGTKFDPMLILCGPQGIGKSTILEKLSRGWYCDNIRSFEGKEAAEMLQGRWIIEIAELDAFDKSTTARIKTFLSQTCDRYRAAYGRNVKEQRRTCVFFGTCNDSEFLRDTTGNRRFWPVDVGIRPSERRPWHLVDYDVDQIWAEAVHRWREGEQLFLTGGTAVDAITAQNAHRITSMDDGAIHAFMDREVPVNWEDWTIDRRRDYWAGLCEGDTTPTRKREYICTKEIWTELFNGGQTLGSSKEARAINAAIRAHGWQESGGSTVQTGAYGRQRYYTPPVGK